jgi:hypothetical protein
VLTYNAAVGTDAVAAASKDTWFGKRLHLVHGLVEICQHAVCSSIVRWTKKAAYNGNSTLESSMLQTALICETPTEGVTCQTAPTAIVSLIARAVATMELL